MTEHEIKKIEERLAKMGSYLYEFVEEARINALS